MKGADVIIQYASRDDTYDRDIRCNNYTTYEPPKYAHCINDCYTMNERITVLIDKHFEIDPTLPEKYLYYAACFERKLV